MRGGGGRRQPAAFITSSWSDADLAARPDLIHVGGPVLTEGRAVIAVLGEGDPAGLIAEIDRIVAAMRSDGTDRRLLSKPLRWPRPQPTHHTMMTGREFGMDSRKQRRHATGALGRVADGRGRRLPEFTAGQLADARS